MTLFPRGGCSNEAPRWWNTTRTSLWHLPPPPPLPPPLDPPSHSQSLNCIPLLLFPPIVGSISHIGAVRLHCQAQWKGECWHYEVRPCNTVFHTVFQAKHPFPLGLAMRRDKEIGRTGNWKVRLGRPKTTEQRSFPVLPVILCGGGRREMM